MQVQPLTNPRCHSDPAAALLLPRTALMSSSTKRAEPPERAERGVLPYHGLHRTLGKGSLGTHGLYRLLKPEASEPYPWGWLIEFWCLICKRMGSCTLMRSGPSSVLRGEDSQCRKLKVICGHVHGIHTISSASAYTSSPKPFRTSSPGNGG